MTTSIATGRLERQPDNMNQLMDNKFAFRILKLPNIEFWTQTVNIPGLSMESIIRWNVFNKTHYGPTKLEYSNFTLEFLVDEELKNYLELENWLRGIAAPEEFKEHSEFLSDNRLVAPRGVLPPATIYSDARLLISSNSNTPNHEIVFQDLFPVSLSGLTFTVGNDTINHSKATAEFVYRQYKINPE